MANQQQKRRDAKQAKRKKLSKDKAKAVRRNEHKQNSFLSGLSDEQADRIKHKSIYDVLNDASEMKRRAKAGESCEELFTNRELFEGIDSMCTMCIKVHSGVAVLMKLADDEQRIVLTESQRALIEEYERSIVEFNEDIQVISVLDRAGKQPVEYPEIVIHTADVMNTLMGDLRESVLTLLTEYRDLIEGYAQEHRPKDRDMYYYMSGLHEARVVIIMPLYATGAAKELLQDALSMTEEQEDETGAEAVDDLENLAPLDPEDDSIVAVQPPQDPVTESQAQ